MYRSKRVHKQGSPCLAVINADKMPLGSKFLWRNGIFWEVYIIGMFGDHRIYRSLSYRKASHKLTTSKEYPPHEL